VRLTEGIALVKTDDIPVGRSLNDVALPEEAEARESEVDSLLVERVARFFGTHTLQFKVPKDSIQDMQRALDECEYPMYYSYKIRNDNSKFQSKSWLVKSCSVDVVVVMVTGSVACCQFGLVVQLPMPASALATSSSVWRNNVVSV